MKIADLLIAAASEAAGAVVWHYDADFDRIAAVTGQPTEWIAPARVAVRPRVRHLRRDAPPTAPETARTYEAVIGIECHVQLKTASKMFCGCSTDFQDAPPNSHTCPVCLAMPGVLPVINRLAVQHVLATGIAIGATTPVVTRWDRKNYFYPDLPKGYQISQYDLPLASGGSLTFETSRGPGDHQHHPRPPGGGHGPAHPPGRRGRADR